MKKNFILLILTCCICPMGQARYFLSFVGSRLNLDYKNVQIASSPTDTSGTVELAGIGGGWTTIASGNYGYEFGLALLGTNSQKLTPNPDWGTPFLYRATAKINYSFSFGLFAYTGADILSTLYQEVESHYFGLGFLYGIGYRINENSSIAIGVINSSILFSGDNHRVLRGPILELNYLF